MFAIIMWLFPLYNNKAPVRPVVFVSFIIRSSSYDAVFFVPVPLYYFKIFIFSLVQSNFEVKRDLVFVHYV